MKDACKDEETVPLSPVPGNAEVAGSRRGSRRQLAQATTVLSLKDARPLPTSSAVRYFQVFAHSSAAPQCLIANLCFFLLFNETSSLFVRISKPQTRSIVIVCPLYLFKSLHIMYHVAEGVRTVQYIGSFFSKLDALELA